MTDDDSHPTGSHLGIDPRRLAAAWPYSRVIGHRGAGALAPENTLCAFRRGWMAGCRMFEFDVKLTSDAVAILMHDDRLERTTDGRGTVAATPWPQLTQLDAGSWHSATYAGETVPSLRAVARWLRANDCLANIEIKPCPGRERETGRAVAIEACRLWSGASIPPLLSSFSVQALGAARSVAPLLPRVLLLSGIENDWLQRCKTLDCLALGLEHSHVKGDLIDAVHRSDLRLLVYTVNDPRRASALLRLGVDSLITDAVDAITT